MSFLFRRIHYYDGQYEDADPILEQHAAKYPKRDILRSPAITEAPIKLNY